ncbi:hypothetical protein D3C80_2043140 [compost metagenome]
MFTIATVAYSIGALLMESRICPLTEALFCAKRELDANSKSAVIVFFMKEKR